MFGGSGDESPQDLNTIWLADNSTELAAAAHATAELHAWLVAKLREERRAVHSQLEMLHHELAEQFRVALERVSSQALYACQEEAGAAEKTGHRKAAAEGITNGGQHCNDPECDPKLRRTWESLGTGCRQPEDELLALMASIPDDEGLGFISCSAAGSVSEMPKFSTAASEMPKFSEELDNEVMKEADPSHLADELLVASKHGDWEDISSLLHKQADPNTWFEEFEIDGWTYGGTPLVIAALKGDVDIVSALLEHDAAPDSEYKFVAGKAKIQLTLPASHATIPKKSLDVLQLFLKFKADVNARTSLGGNLLWQAAYSGHLAVVEFLLNARAAAALDVPARSQDDETQHYTPLHAAAKYGHKRVVNKLLEWRADLSGRNLLGYSPLVDAVIQGHGDVVCNLVANSANLSDTRDTLTHSFTGNGNKSTRMLRTYMDEDLRQSSWSTEGESSVPRPIDMLFSHGNGTVIANAALGLMRANPQALNHLERRDFVRFIRTPGEAPAFILQAIMRPYEVRYWDSEFNRVHVTASLTPIGKDYNVALGPHNDELKRLFNTKEPATEDVIRFLGELVPRPGDFDLKGGRLSRSVHRASLSLQTSGRATSTAIASGFKFVPGVLHMCHVVGISEDPDVLQALADCPLPDVFEIETARVILDLHWKKQKHVIYYYIVWRTFYLIVICGINILLVEDYFVTLSFMTWIGVLLGSSELVFNVASVVGYSANGHVSRVLTDLWYWLDLFMVLLNGVLYAVIIIQQRRCKESAVFNMCFGISVFIMWMKVLHDFRSLKVVGERILPITITLQDVGPFCCVLAMYMLGCINAYYALNLSPLWESFIMIFRLTFLGELNLDALENVSPSTYLLEDGTIQTDPAPKGEYHFIVNIFACVVTFVMGTALMNIFIAVLSDCYNKASASANSLFLHARTETVLNAHEVSAGLSLIQKRLFRRFCRARIRRSEKFKAFHYLWYFSPRESVAIDDHA